jgi:hypothetical protein
MVHYRQAGFSGATGRVTCPRTVRDEPRDDPHPADAVLRAALSRVELPRHLRTELVAFDCDRSGDVMAFSYTVLTAVILIVGSMWIMHNVSMNMMSR